MTPLVSIIIPVYNGDNYLTEAIDSALAQTYENIEIIIINDGSTDKTEKIALSYSDKIRYYSKENGGVSTALNMGITLMYGEYFSWLSHDDLYLPDKVRSQVNALVNTPSGIAYSNYDVIDKNGILLATMDIAKHYPQYDLTFGLFPILRQVLNGCTLLIHKSHFARVGNFDERLRSVQDYDLWFKMFRGEKLTYVNESLVRLREHGTQVTHKYEKNDIESEQLWIDMLKSVTKEETIRIDGTERDFWDKQTAFLWYTRYEGARLYAKERLKHLGGRKFFFIRFVKRALYKTLSTISQIVRMLGIQSLIKKSKLFSWGYKLWFRVRYK